MAADQVVEDHPFEAVVLVVARVAADQAVAAGLVFDHTGNSNLAGGNTPSTEQSSQVALKDR